ncbi:MAG TPA: regulatory protein RecX [Trueperaceae bacterium]
MSRVRSVRSGAESRPLPPEKAWNYALTLLTRRAHTEAELTEKLTRRRASPEVVAEVLGRLRRYRLVDDEAFAEAFVRTHAQRKGTLALRRELLRKGVPEEVAEESLVELDDAAQSATAAKLLERNAWRFRGSDPRRNRARAFAFLARRGFPSTVVMEALEGCEWLTSGGDDDAEGDDGGDDDAGGDDRGDDDSSDDDAEGDDDAGGG